LKRAQGGANGGHGQNGQAGGMAQDRHRQFRQPKNEPYYGLSPFLVAEIGLFGRIGLIEVEAFELFEFLFLTFLSPPRQPA
jgi:hypothetical protein